MTNSRRTSRGPVPGRGPAVEKHCTKGVKKSTHALAWAPFC